MHYIVSLFLIFLSFSPSLAARTKKHTPLVLAEISPEVWTTVPSTNTPKQRDGHTSVVSNGELIIFGGCDGQSNCYNDLQSFNPKNGEWTTINAGGFLPEARMGHSAVILGNSMYVFGGWTGKKYLNDVQIFDFTSPKNSWYEGDFQQTPPSPRAYQAMSLDELNRIVIFGGFNTEDGYLGDVNILDPFYGIWSPTTLNGESPGGRTGASMTRFQDIFYIFGGGNAEGGQNDIHTLNLELNIWSKMRTSGTKPLGRQNHRAIAVENELYIIAGCNPEIDSCFQDTWIFNVETEWWSTSTSYVGVLPRMQLFSASPIGPNIFIFGGTNLEEENGENGFYIFNDEVSCPNECSNEGNCTPNGCVCFPGNFENDCSLSVNCPGDCSGNGICQTNMECQCYPGYTGSSCDILTHCPKNCTNDEHGICQSNGECKCNYNFTGPSCQHGQEEPLKCPNNCSGFGTCNTTNGECNCEANVTGADCNTGIQIENGEVTYYNMTLAKENEEAQKALLKAAEEEEQQDSGPVVTPPPNHEEEEVEAAGGTTTKLIATKKKAPPTINTAELDVIFCKLNKNNKISTRKAMMFGHVFMAQGENFNPGNLQSCPNDCTFRGVCENNACYCQAGFYGNDCSSTNSEIYSQGQTITSLEEWGLISLVVGIILGIIVLVIWKFKKGDTEYQGINNDEHDL